MHTGRLDLDDDLGDENPAARAQYELERLRDPATGNIPPGIRQRELEYARTLPTVERLRATGKRAGAAAVDDWTARGPTNISGRTRALAYDVSDPDTWLAGGVSGGMWRTTNQGQSWTKQTTPGQLHSVTCITQDTRPGYTDVWFYGTGEYLGDSASEHFSARYSGDGIYRSTDGGLTWAPLPTTQSGTPQDFDNDFDYVWNIVTAPTAQGQSVVLAATIGGIFRSNDNGDNWARVLGDGFAAAGIRYESDIAVSSQGVFYATVRPLDGGATEFGFYRSTDGVNWTRLNTLNGFRRSVLAIAPSDENEVFILAYTPSSGVNDTEFWQYTYVSGDGTGAGGTFTDLTSNIPDGDGRFHFEHQRAYDLVVAVDPGDVSTVFIGGTSLFRSTDGFTTGNNIAIIGGYNPDDPGDSPDSYRYPNQHPDQHAIVFLPDGTLLTGHDGGVSHTTDPYANSVTWTFRNEGYVTTQFYSVATDPTTPGERMVVGGMQDNGGWVAPGGATDWSIVTAGDGMMTNVADGGSDYYTSSQRGRVYRSQLDAGGTTLQQARVDPCEPGDSRFFTPFLLDPADQTRMVLTAAEVIWRNGDITAIPWGNESCTGTNWTSLDNFKAPAGEEVTALAMPRNGGRLYFGTTDGRVFYGDDVMTSDPNPVEVTDAAFGGGYVSSITTDPVDTDRVYLTLSSYDNPSIFVSDDAGATWTDVGGNLEPPDGSGPSVRWIDVFYDGGRRIYFVGTSTGLYSTDELNGASTVWAQEGATSIGNVVVDMVRVRQDKLGLSTDGYVAVATHGNGIYDTFYPVKRVTGTITDADGDPVEGVVLNGLPGNPTTDASGTYEATMDWQWQGSATPSKPGFTFNPVTRNYSGTPFRSKLNNDYRATETNTYAQVPEENLELWLKDAGLHLSYDSQSGFQQGMVIEWEDQSGASWDFIQILPGRLPFYRALSFNDRGGVDFDGVDDFLRGGFSLDGAEEASVFLVFKQDGTQSGTYPFAMPEAESGLNGFDLETGGVNRLRSHVNADGFTTAEAIEDFGDPGRVVTARYWPPGILNTHRIYVNGKERGAQTNSGPIEAGANATFLGAFSDDYGGYFEGEIAEVLVYSRSLGRAERSAVENYLGLKYGLGWKTVAAPMLSSNSTGVYVLGTTGAAVNFTDPPSQSGSLSATAGTDPGTIGALPPGLDEVLPDQYWTVDAFLSDYGYSITVDLRDFDLSGVSAFTDLTLLKRDDETSPWQYATGQGDVTLVHHEPYLTAAGLTSFSDFAIGVVGGTVNLTVSAETDVVDANGGDCVGLDFVLLPGPDDEISLREAICAANATSRPVSIGLPAGTYMLSIAGTGEDASATGDLDVVGDLTLSGVGAGSTVIDAAGIDRVLELVSGSLTLDGVTVTGGQAPGNFSGESGGGIRSGGDLSVRNSTVVGNAAGNGSYFGGSGGGIYVASDGTLNVERSLVAGNVSGSSTNGTAGAGGGIWASGPAEIVNSTLSGNTTGAGSSTRGNGGGIGANVSPTLRYTTVVGNEAHRGGGIYEGNTGASITLAAVLVANNTADDQGADCYADVVSDDYNLIENATGCDISGTTAHNITGQDPALSPLQDNGGPTDTHLPKFGGPGLDVIPNGTLDCGTTVQVDQRAQPRPTDSDDSGTATCDIGAVEPTYDEIAPVVTNLDDSGNGSLRGVLAAVASGTTVTFDPSLSGQTIDLTSGQLTLDTDVTVDAAALPESITIQGGPGRVFWVTSTANATLSHLTIRGGNTDFGGGISNDGTLTVRSSTIRNNEASDRGGGIDNDGTLTLEQVTVEGNRASGGAGGVNNAGTLTILSSTIYDNEGQQGGDGDGNIYNAGEMHLIGSIVASGDGGDCLNVGTLGSVVYSLVEDGTCLPSGSTTNLTGDPELGALQDNGGGMLTYAPLSGSPVIDQGSCSGYTTDQRGEDRPYDDLAIPNADDGCDMGSVEVPGPDAIDLAVTAFLEGPMQSVQMAVGLTDHLPETDPYFGTQSVPSGYFTSDPDGQRVVDWVVLQLRTGDPANPPMTVAAERAALLLDDGTVQDTDGSPTVTMDGAPGAYYVVVGHRNHLWAMSDVAVNCSGGSCGFDFTAGTVYGTNALKDLGGGLFGLYAGDGNASGGITASDQTVWLDANGTVGYLLGDYNLSGGNTATDQTLWLGNNGTGSQVPLDPAESAPARDVHPVPTGRGPERR